MPRSPIGTQDDIKRYNLTSLLELIHVQGAMSRAELTELTSLNRSTVKLLCAELVDVGLLHEGPGVATGRAGRPSRVIGPQAERVHALALNVGVESLTAVRVGLGGVVLERREHAQTADDLSVDVTVDRLAGLAGELMADSAADGTCIGVGISVCGMTSDQDGVVHFAPNLGWHEVPLRAQFVERLGTRLPVHIGNDADIGALAEHRRGAARGMRDIVYLSGAVGLGGGILVGGRPLEGAGGFGGEIGHMLINSSGRRCRCGRRGCWETEIGDDAVLRSTGSPPGVTVEDVLAAHAGGAEWTAEGMRRVGSMLAAGVVNLINIFNPEAIIFGGTSHALFTATEAEVRAAIDLALPAPGRQVQLLTPKLGADVLALGAAELAFAALLADPVGLLASLRRTGRSGRRPATAACAADDHSRGRGSA